MNMLSCDLNRLSEVPLYEQLYSYIKKEIIDGRLLYGTKLPSKRKLAEFLQISQNTVETAYEQLTAEGYVEVIPRKGYYIQTFEDLEYTQTNQVSLEQSNHKEGELLYHFHPSQIDTEHFPFEKWRKYMKSKIDESHQDLLLLGDNQGEYELRCEIAHYLYHARGVQCVPEQIIIGAGMEILLQQLVLLFDKNAIYGVEDPGYHLIHRILRSYPNEVHPLQIDEEGVKVNQIEDSKIDVVYVTPSHHFPNGTILSVNRRTRLLNWAQGAANRYIIEDDYDSEFRYTQKPFPALASIDSARVIYLGNFSKSFLPGIRLSYMVLPQPLLNRYKNQFLHFEATTSLLSQLTMAKFMEEGEWSRHIKRMRLVYKRKMQHLVSALKEQFGQNISIIGEQSGLYVLVKVHLKHTEEWLIQQASSHGVTVYPTSLYFIKNNTDGPMVKLGFSKLSSNEIDVGVKLLKKAWFKE